MKEMKLKIVDIMKEMKQSKDTTIGVLAFLKNEHDTEEMLNWLTINKGSKPSQNDILEKLDLITN